MHFCIKIMFWFILILTMNGATNSVVMAEDPEVDRSAELSDELLEFFQTRRQLYGDIATREQLEQLKTVGEQNPESPNPDETVFIIVLIAAAAFGIVAGGIISGRFKAGKSLIPMQGTGRKMVDSEATQGITIGEGDLDIPSKLPGTWFAQLDPQIRKQRLESARDDATALFFEKLGKQGIPTPSDLKIATCTMGQMLTDRVESIEWIESFCGEKATHEQRDYLKLHLRELLIPPKIPDPTLIRLEMRMPVICVIAAVGAVLGMVLGGWVVKNFLDNVPVELGYILGAPAVSALALGFVLLVATNETVRNRILFGLGIVGGIDIALQIFKGFLPWPILGGKLAFAKRLLLYGMIGFILFVSRRENICDHNHYRSEVEGIVEQWLHSAMAIIAVLTFKVESLEDNPFHPKQGDSQSLVDIAGIAQNLKQAAPDDLPIYTNMLIQKLQTRGFLVTDESQTESVSSLIWEESMREQYQTAGIIREGDTIKIEKEPILRNGIVEQKGLVRKK